MVAIPRPISYATMLWRIQAGHGRRNPDDAAPPGL